MSQLRSSDSYDIGVNTSSQSQSGFSMSDPRMELISTADRRVPLYIETSPQLLPPVRWQPTFPNAASFNPDRQLQLMNQEMQRLTNEMNRLWREAGRYQDFPALDFRPFSDAFSLVPQIGGAAHAESWRKKENFHLDNPVVKDREGRHQFRLEFDLRQFRPEEIVVTTEGNLLTVQAKHEETGAGKKARREYFRQCTIPSNVDPLALVSRHTQSGILSVYAPVPIEEEFRMIPIKQK